MARFLRDLGSPPIALCLLLASTFAVYWRDSETLFRHTLAVTSDNVRTHELLGLYLAGTQRFEEAIAHYSQALRIEPGFNRARFHLGQTLAMNGDLESAAAELRQVLVVEPNDPRASHMLALVLARLESTQRFRSLPRVP